MLTSPSALRPAVDPDVWEILDRHLQHLAATADVARQLRLTLEAVRGSLAADAVLVYSERTRQVQEVVGPADLAVSGPLVARLVALAGEGQVVATAPDETSAALLRLSRSRAVWMVALRGAADAPFTQADLKLMAFAR